MQLTNVGDQDKLLREIWLGTTAFVGWKRSSGVTHRQWLPMSRVGPTTELHAADGLNGNGAPERSKLIEPDPRKFKVR